MSGVGNGKRELKTVFVIEYVKYIKMEKENIRFIKKMIDTKMNVG